MNFTTSIPYIHGGTTTHIYPFARQVCFNESLFWTLYAASFVILLLARRVPKKSHRNQLIDSINKYGVEHTSFDNCTNDNLEEMLKFLKLQDVKLRKCTSEYDNAYVPDRTSYMELMRSIGLAETTTNALNLISNKHVFIEGHPDVLVRHVDNDSRMFAALVCAAEAGGRVALIHELQRSNGWNTLEKWNSAHIASNMFNEFPEISFTFEDLETIALENEILTLIIIESRRIHGDVTARFFRLMHAKSPEFQRRVYEAAAKTLNYELLDLYNH